MMLEVMSAMVVIMLVDGRSDVDGGDDNILLRALVHGKMLVYNLVQDGASRNESSSGTPREDDEVRKTPRDHGALSGAPCRKNGRFARGSLYPPAKVLGHIAPKSTTHRTIGYRSGNSS